MRNVLHEKVQKSRGGTNGNALHIGSSKQVQRTLDNSQRTFNNGGGNWEPNLTPPFRSWLAAKPMLTRRQFIGGTAALALGGGFDLARLRAQAPAEVDLAFVNGRIHTMDAATRV